MDRLGQPDRVDRLDRLSALLQGLAPAVAVRLLQPQGLTVHVAACDERFLHLYLLLEGSAELHCEGQPALTLAAPCVALYRSDRAHQLIGGAADTFQHLLGAQAWLRGPMAGLLLSEFTEPRVVALDSADPLLLHIVSLIAAELAAPRCGHPALLDRAGDILFIGVLRHLVAYPDAEGGTGGTGGTDGANRTAGHGGGLLSGLADARLARALVSIHARPQSGWTLQTLADEAGMSRTAFAERFRQVMQLTPGRYLAAVRLAIARSVLDAGQGLKQAARASGYESPAALSRALSRTRAAAVD